MKEVIQPESDLLRKISSDLSRQGYEPRGLKEVAERLGLPREDYVWFVNRGERRSPTRVIFNKVVTDRPVIAILEIIKALENIDRYDVIEVIKEELGKKNLMKLFQQIDICF